MPGPRAEGEGEVLRALQRRFSAANLRVQIAECENRLTELVEFERGWRDLVGQVRPLMQACDHDDWPLARRQA